MNAKLIKPLTLYSFSHLFVDALCISGVLVLGFVNNLSNETGITLILLYNVLAFASQAIIGFLCDLFRKPKYFAIIGCALSVIAVLFLKVPILAMIIFSLGNGFFHIGGGVTSLYLTPGKAFAPGIFVAPGAIGVFLATYYTQSLLFVYIFTSLTSLSLILIVLLPTMKKHDFIRQKPMITNRFLLIMVSLLMVICIRSLVGGGIFFIWKTSLFSRLLLLSALVFGKAFGGVLGDRFGFKLIGLGGLILSAIFLYVGSNLMIFGLLGVFMFNLTMPITLTSLANIFKTYKGFAFGLTTLSLAVGYLINREFSYLYSKNSLFVLVVIILSAIGLYIGLQKEELHHD